MEAKRLDDISILRVLCIIIVVFFHCYGMMYAESHFPATVSVYDRLYFIPNQCVFINIAMPMFIFVSGYLFQYLLMKGKYQTWSDLLKKKGLRILLPYFVFGTFFMATTGNFHPINLFNGGYWHLWFLPMLFWCFIFGYLVYKAKLGVSFEMVFLFLTFIGVIVPRFIPMWMGLHNITCWFYWFYLGMLMYKYRECLLEGFRKPILCVLLLSLSLFIICYFPVAYGGSKWYGNLAVTFSIISISTLMSKVDWGKYKITTSITKFSAYSFGIYIWHNWVALMLISNTSKRLFGLEALAANHVILFPLCFSLITLAISWFLSWCMMKTKVGRFLIG